MGENTRLQRRGNARRLDQNVPRAESQAVNQLSDHEEFPDNPAPESIAADRAPIQTLEPSSHNQGVPRNVVVRITGDGRPHGARYQGRTPAALHDELCSGSVPRSEDKAAAGENPCLFEEDGGTEQVEVDCNDPNCSRNRSAYRENSRRYMEIIPSSSHEDHGPLSKLYDYIGTYTDWNFGGDNQAQSSRDWQKELTNAQRLLQTRRKEMEATQKELVTKQEQLERSVAQISEQSLQLETSSKRLNVLEGQVQQLRRDKASVENSLRLAQQGKQLIEAEVAEARRTVSSVQLSYAELLDKSNQTEDQLAALKREGLERVRKSNRAVLDDAQVRRRLQSEFSKGLSDWSKDYTRADLSSAGEKGQELLKRGLVSVATENSGVSHEELAREIRPSGFVQSILTHFVSVRILQQPFLEIILMEKIGQPVRDVRRSSVLLEFFETFKKIDEKRANIWRSDLLTSEMDASKSRKLVENYSQILVKELEESGLYDLLEQEDFEEAMEELAAIFKEICIVTVELWRQRTYLQVHRADYLGERRFKHVSRDDLKCLMVADGTYKLDGSANPEKFDGERISMVIQPAIIACGNENGEDYSLVSKIWVPAIVRLAVRAKDDRISRTFSKIDARTDIEDSSEDDSERKSEDQQSAGVSPEDRMMDDFPNPGTIGARNFLE